MKKIFAFLTVLLFTNCAENPQQKEVAIQQTAQLIHLKTTTLDTHNDIDVKNFTGNMNYSQDTDTQVNLPKMQAGALDVSWFIVYTKQGDLTPQGYKKAADNAQSKFDAIHRLTEVYAPSEIGLAVSSREVDSLRKMGKKVAIVDLTQGELGSRGTIETRYEEAAEAMKIMGVHARENLKMQDGFFTINEENKLKIVEQIRSP